MIVPFTDVSYNEDGEKEYSIHALDADMLADLICAAELMGFMLDKKLVLEAFNGVDLNINNANRAEKIQQLVRDAKATLTKR